MVMMLTLTCDACMQRDATHFIETNTHSFRPYKHTPLLQKPFFPFSSVSCLVGQSNPDIFHSPEQNSPESHSILRSFQSRA
ncbi:hypothetical protein QVD17_18527 [Tagetes erecta]|uniref:Uncharacterized protein n=1 Tax=Tagetes erecta TaxID=13708 RepID=A0AAD8KHX2_TARER|nr:hypothetical protein QVD17_18527 [Tagetes erecta]